MQPKPAAKKRGGAAKRKLTPEQQLCEDIAGFGCDLFGLCMYLFPWGVPGTPLEKIRRPRAWQEKFLRDLSRRLTDTVESERYEVLREAIVSGHGVGKSAVFGILIVILISTYEFTRGLVTANTESQLQGKTWPEVQKWHSMSRTKHWFKPTATALFHVNPEYEKRWRFDCVTWSENNTEAFAGLHNEGNRIVLIFDEASAIPPKIWEVAEGATTDAATQILWLVAGNPTRPIGRFKECFAKLKHRWNPTHVDAREVEGTNKELQAQWARDYGVESDFYKVRVRGEFPSASPLQLIPEEWIYRAVRAFPGDGSVVKQLISADVADGGVDLSVITSALEYQTHLHVTKQRQFNFPSSESPIKVARAVLTTWDSLGCSAANGDKTIVDSMGVGAGTAGYVMEHAPCIAYKGGAASADPKKWRNRRVQCYINVRDAFRDQRISIDPECFETQADLDDFVEQLCSIMRVPAGDKVEDIQTKEAMLRDGIKSPDRADSLAMLYAASIPTLMSKNSEAARAQTMQVIYSTVNSGLDGL